MRRGLSRGPCHCSPHPLHHRFYPATYPPSGGSRQSWSPRPKSRPPRGAQLPTATPSGLGPSLLCPHSLQPLLGARVMLAGSAGLVLPQQYPQHPHTIPTEVCPALWLFGRGERASTPLVLRAEGVGAHCGVTGQAERRYLGPGRGQVPSPRGASSHARGSVLGPGAAGALCQPGQPWCAKCQRQGQTALPPQHPLGCLCLALQASPLRCCKAFAECLALPKLRWQLTGAGMCLAGLCPMPGHRAQALGHAPMWKQSGGDPAACSSRGDAWSGLQSPPAQCCGSLYGPPGEADHQRCSEQKAVLRRHQPWAAPGRCVGLRGCLPSPFLHRRAGAWGLRSQPQLPLWSQ